jgi:hypothetical protein
MYYKKVQEEEEEAEAEEEEEAEGVTSSVTEAGKSGKKSQGTTEQESRERGIASGVSPTSRDPISRDKLSDSDDVPQPRCRMVSPLFVCANLSQIACPQYTAKM